MKPYVVVLVFMALVLSSAVTGIGSYRRTAHAIDQDLHQALSKTLMEKRSDRITADTIRTYRQYLTIEELRERAYLAMKVTRRDGQSRLEMVGSVDGHHLPDVGSTTVVCPDAGSHPLDGFLLSSFFH